MEITSAVRYAADRLGPHVADLLHSLSNEFTSGEVWSSDRSDEFPRGRKLQAQPLENHDTWRDARTGALISFNASADVRLGEYNWRITPGLRTVKGAREGIVEMDSCMRVRLAIPSGDLKQLDNGKRGFLCWAEECELPNGDTCIKLKTKSGTLWLATAQPGRHKLYNAFRSLDAEPSVIGRPIVVHLAEWHYSRWFDERPACIRCMVDDPWQGLKTRDTSGRPWLIVKSQAQFSASLALDVVGRYNDRLNEREQRVIMPPYEAVWRPPADEDSPESPLVMLEVH